MFRHYPKILAGVLAPGMLAVVVAYAQTPNRDEPPFRVTRYDVQLEPRLGSRTVVGTATLSVVMQRGDAALNAMSPGAGERRTSVEFFEVPVHTVS